MTRFSTNFWQSLEHKKEDETRESKTSCNEAFPDLYVSNVVRIIKFRVRWAHNVARVEEKSYA